MDETHHKARQESLPWMMWTAALVFATVFLPIGFLLSRRSLASDDWTEVGIIGMQWIAWLWLRSKKAGINAR